MTGFKSGASDDNPLANEEDQQDEPAESSPPSESTSQEETEPVSTSPSETALPWLYRRNSITDGRAKTVQLHLQQSTLDEEHEGLRDVPIQEAVQKADFREAAYLVGMQHLDEVAEQLQQWGYDFD